jgi:hypothetical protein
MLEPRYIEQGGFVHLELCEHNWLALPGIWALDILPEKLKARKLWFYATPFIRMHLESMDCQCAKFLELLVRKDHETMPTWDSAIDVSRCSPACGGNSPGSSPCPAYRLLQWWNKYWRGYMTDRELLNRFLEFTIEWSPPIVERQVRASREKFGLALIADLLGNPFQTIEIKQSWLEWNCGAVGAIAQTTYDDLAFGDMPILADALESAGCTHSDLLTHCRDGAFHVRGCWALDLLLGK